MRKFLIPVVLCLVVWGSARADDVGTAEAPAECVFPFKYLGMDHTVCINLNGARPWCSTDRVYNGSWQYCKQEKLDMITNDHFLKVLEQAKALSKRLENLKNASSDAAGGAADCNACMERLRPIITEVNLQKNIFLDQNRRLIGLDLKVKRLSDLKDQLMKSHRRRFCRQTDHGMDYLGDKFITKSGRTCQAWASQSPHRHEMTFPSQFPDNSVARAKNYCRNPDNRATPWCYTTDRKVGAESCIIPKCNVECKYDDKGPKHLPWCDEFQDMTCPNGYSYYLGYCYRAEKSARKNWSQAEAECRKAGGHLASVHSYGENMFLRRLIPGGSKRFWIGGSDSSKERTWVWTDGSKFDFKYWHTGEPNNYRNEDCIELNWYTSMPQSWNDNNCGTSNHYICKTKATTPK